MTAESILDRLKKGNERFTHDKLEGKLTDQKRRDELASGQNPFAIVLSCADSRVVPEMVFDTGLGELFVIRVAGNVANSSSIASIEYAVAHLGCKFIVVLGHQSCGAVTAAIEGGDNGYNLNHLLSHITPAIAACGDKPVNEIVKMNAKLNVDSLIERSSIVQNAVESGNLKVIAAYYNLDNGKVDFL